MQQLVGGPEGEVVLRGLRHVVAFVAGDSRRENLAIQVGIAAEDLPLGGQAAAEAQFHALHALFAVKDLYGAEYRIGYPGIGLVGAEQGCVKRQGIVQHIPLGADLVVAAAFRIQIRVGGADFLATVAGGFPGRVAGGRPGGIDAAVGRRLVDHADLAGSSIAIDRPCVHWRTDQLC
ncbi:hypothetical protein D9M71_484880 [compost metagenome]